MAQLNANTPYIECFIRNEYIKAEEGLTENLLITFTLTLNPLLL